MDNSTDSSPLEGECVKLYEKLSALWVQQVYMPERTTTQSKDLRGYLKKTGLQKKICRQWKTLGVLWLAKFSLTE